MAKSKSTILPTGLKSPKEVFKHYSTWLWLVLLGSPDLYQQALASGLITDQDMPQAVKYFLRSLGFLGALSKFINQQKPR